MDSTQDAAAASSAEATPSSGKPPIPPSSKPKTAGFKPAFMPTALRVRRQGGIQKTPPRAKSPSPEAVAQLVASAATTVTPSAKAETPAPEEAAPSVEPKAEESKSREEDPLLEEVLRAATGSSTSSSLETIGDRDAEQNPTSTFHTLTWFDSGCRRLDDAYERVRTLGRGRSGVVHLARPREGGAMVALKRLHSSTDNTGASASVEGVPLEALREVLALAQLSHPNVIGLREVCVGGGLAASAWYAVLEHAEYELGALLEFATRPFSEAHVKSLMQQLLRGLAALHRRWLVHRDLKMPNLLVTRDGVLKLCDFGLSRGQGGANGPYTPGVVSGWYRAPELLLGDRAYGPAIDLWAVGCLFAEMCTRKPLFPGKSEMDQLSRILATCGPPDAEKDAGVLAMLERAGVALPPPSDSPDTALRTLVPRYGYDPRDVHGAERFQNSALSDSGFDLLRRCLAIDHSRRISAEAALEHPWFRELPKPERVPPELLSRLYADHVEGAKKEAEKKEAEKTSSASADAAARIAASLQAARNAAATFNLANAFFPLQLPLPPQ